MNKNYVKVYPKRIEVSYNGKKYVFNDFNRKRDDDYWNSIGEVEGEDMRDINVFLADEETGEWQANLYDLKFEDGSWVINTSTDEEIEVIKVW